MLHQLTFAGQPPITPRLDVACFRYELPADLTQRLALAVMAEKPRILADTPVPTWPGNNMSLTSRFSFYNLFARGREEFAELEEHLRTAYLDYMTGIGYSTGPAYIRGWANAYTHNDRLVWHNHFEALRGSAPPVWAHISGNVCVQTFGTKTWYLSPFLGGVGHDEFGDGYDYPADVLGVENRNGETFLFPSWLVHRTEPNTHPTEPRITIAYDIVPEHVYLSKPGEALFKPFV